MTIKSHLIRTAKVHRQHIRLIITQSYEYYSVLVAHCHVAVSHAAHIRSHVVLGDTCSMCELNQVNIVHPHSFLSHMRVRFTIKKHNITNSSSFVPPLCMSTTQHSSFSCLICSSLHLRCL